VLQADFDDDLAGSQPDPVGGRKSPPAADAGARGV